MEPTQTNPHETMNHNFIITSHNGCGSIHVWSGRIGWLPLHTDSGSQVHAWVLNSLGQKYQTVGAAQRALKRMNTRCPNSILTKNAGYLTRDEAWLDGDLNVPLLLGKRKTPHAPNTSPRHRNS